MVDRAASTATIDIGSKVSWLAGTTVRAIGRSEALELAVRVLSQFGAAVDHGESATRADITLVDRIADLGGRSASEYAGYVAAENSGVWVTASAYGLATTRSDVVASELSLLAAGGILGHSRIGDNWAPTIPPGVLAQKMVGYVIAVSALHALHSFRSSGTPVHVDLSAQQTIISTGLTLEMAHALSNCLDEGGSARYGAPSGFFECLDGSIYVLVLEQHQWQAFRTVLTPALDGVETLVQARDDADYVNGQLHRWTSTRTVEECERTLQEAGVPCTAVNTLDSLTRRAREVGRPLDLTGDDASPLPAVIETHSNDLPERRQTGISKVRVLDAGHVLAVPLGTAWLGAMGAQVTKLEDPQRLDVYRRRGPFAGGKAGLNRSAYFNQLNFSKKTLDVAVDAGASDLDLSAFDVVVHNLTPRRAAAVGVDIASVLAEPAPKLAIASSGFGGTGEWANYRAYGHNIHAFAGLVAATRDARGEMGDMGTPWADPLTSVALAAWVLAWSLASEQDTSVGVDISMSELTAFQLTRSSLDSSTDEYTAPAGEFHGFVRIGDDNALAAVSLRNKREQSTFELLTGRELARSERIGQMLSIPDFELDGRKATVAELSEVLSSQGIPASLVYTAKDLAQDPFVRSTGLYRTVRNRDLGDHDITGLPWKFVGEERPAVAPAPERPAES